MNGYLDSLKERRPILGILALQVWLVKDSSYVKTMSFHMGESRKLAISCWLALVLV